MKLLEYNCFTGELFKRCYRKLLHWRKAHDQGTLVQVQVYIIYPHLII